jgi:hypothetical protein
MFTLEQPSMALNSTEISWSKISMWNTWEVDRAQTREHIVEWVATVASGAPGNKLKNVVINCHGLPGWVGIGQGFNRTHLGLFRQWVGKVDKIWFVACLVARIPDTQMLASRVIRASAPGTEMCFARNWRKTRNATFTPRPRNNATAAVIRPDRCRPLKACACRTARRDR